MAVQVSYPGVYIEETEPAAPIQGVSTSVAAFIGISGQGPIAEPTLVTSPDAFTAQFGPPVDGGDVPYYLPLAVDGFFRNGGTQCFVLRVGTATPAGADLPGRATGAPAVARAVALLDGPDGAGGSVRVTDSSALGAALTAAGAGTDLPVARGTANITAVDATRRVLTVNAVDGLAAGERVVVAKGAETRKLRVRSVQAPDTIVLDEGLSGATDFVGGTVTSDDLAAGDTVLRFTVPAGIALRPLVPVGSSVRIGDGTNTEWGIVAAVTNDALTLRRPLTKVYRLAGPTRVATAEFDLTVTDRDGNAATYPNLSTTPSHPRWWGGPVVPRSYLRIVISPNAPTPVGDPRPKAGTYVLAGAVADDPATSWADVAGRIDEHLKLLRPIDEISLVLAPGCTDIGAQRAIVEHCESLYDRFAILDSAPGIDVVTVKAQRAQLTGALDKGFAALYYPWIQLRDPAKVAVVLQPPSGHIAGIYAHTDATRGVHKAPANVGIAGALGLERRLGDADQGLLNPDGVNALRILPGRGSPVVWGARTTTGDRNWQYINVRRLFLFLEESIQEGLRGAVFEPNDLELWGRLRHTLTEFLTRVWRDGALFGAKAKDAFFVRIDEALNPPSTRKLGLLYIEIGVQPVYPAEFIVVRIGIWDGGAEVSEQ
ncbi:phage tail sheath subtilisin-like domain-containing protein [Embleya scabrispora]|uniref:phage tail sheath subtilisin-like domain-containing protein n=1 Tax=Embleya scabrispora TaxID=159449 RepID=UPI00036873C5|nr:phage tail sheath subtilisin-like domain-containing protein [Embleya scabrispora]MYS85056.1 phage tail sheath family protein [Streptomyces sp. SID5474]